MIRSAFRSAVRHLAAWLLLTRLGGLDCAGQTWTQTSAPIGSYWTSLASSTDGTRLFASEQLDAAFKLGRIHVSTDSGLTWRPSGAPANDWWSVACSADGRKLVATAHYDKIYVSLDAGATWRSKNVARNWGYAGCSGDGARMIVAPAGYPIQLSTDSGATWQTTATPATNWFRIAVSTGGRVMAATAGAFAVKGGSLYLSTNGGVAWKTAAFPPTDLKYEWRAVALSADGAKILLVGSDSGSSMNGPVFTSTDTGATWRTDNLPFSSGGWSAAASSADGTRLLIAGNSSARSPMYSSPDSGRTWQRVDVAAQTWYGLTSSADGTKLAGVAYYDGRIWTGGPALPPVLTLERLGADPFVSWPAATADGFVLEQNPNLNPAEWVAIGTPPTVVGPVKRVAVPATGLRGFYRLRSP